MRIVCDTNILARANPNSSGVSRRLLDLILDGPHDLIVSQPILDELEATLAYPRLQKLWPAGDRQIREFRDAVGGFAEIVTPAQGPSVVPDDPDDDVVVYTAVAGRADVICTRDSDFYAPETLQFCRRRGIRIMPDDDLVATLSAQAPR